MNTRTDSGVAVLLSGERRAPRALAGLPNARIDDRESLDAAADRARRLVVVGSDADLATVLTRLLRRDLLDVEVAHVRGRPGWLAARRALRGTARRVPLIRDDAGVVLVGAACWLPPTGATSIHGEAVVDDTVLFDGEVAAVRIEPIPAMPGLRAMVLDGRRRRWVVGRAAQLGATGAQVLRDGVPGPRAVKRSTFYRHTTGWLRVR